MINKRQWNLGKRKGQSFVFNPLLTEHDDHGCADKENGDVKTDPPEQGYNPGGPGQSLVGWEPLVKPGGGIVISDDKPVRQVVEKRVEPLIFR